MANFTKLISMAIAILSAEIPAYAENSSPSINDTIDYLNQRAIANKEVSNYVGYSLNLIESASSGDKICFKELDENDNESVRNCMAINSISLDGTRIARKTADGKITIQLSCNHETDCLIQNGHPIFSFTSMWFKSDSCYKAMLHLLILLGVKEHVDADPFG